jgi:hypothetical protein
MDQFGLPARGARALEDPIDEDVGVAVPTWTAYYAEYFSHGIPHPFTRFDVYSPKPAGQRYLSSEVKVIYGWEGAGMSRGIIILIVAIVVAGIVGASYFFLGQSDNGGDDDQDVAYQVGDYLEWTQSIAAPNSTMGDPYSIQRYTIVDVGSVWITINRTYMDAAMDFLSSSQYSLPANTTFGSFTAIPISVSSNDMTAHGTDIISTKWGNITADHYQWTNQIGGEDVTSDIWMVGGVFLKMVTPSAEYNNILELSDGNFDQLMNL